LEKKPEPKPEPKKPEPIQLKKATPRTIPKPAEEKPAPGIEIKLKKTAPAQVEKPQHEEPKLPTLKHVEHKSAEKVEETKVEHHLKHVEEKHVQEEVRGKRYCL
jgi:colicin import membrane protein